MSAVLSHMRATLGHRLVKLTPLSSTLATLHHVKATLSHRLVKPTAPISMLTPRIHAVAAQSHTVATSGHPRRGARSPLSHQALVLVGQRVSAEGQHHQAGAVDEHHGAAPVGVHPHFGDVHVLHEAVLRVAKEGGGGRVTGPPGAPQLPSPAPSPTPTRSSGSSK